MAEFSCRADVDADDVFWTVNDISVNRLNDSNISEDYGPEVGGVPTLILRIIADVQHNNSVIQCKSILRSRAFSVDGETPSDPALLMVQGT